jgi:hypothetical protein
MLKAPLDLSRNLTEKRIPAELQGHEAYCLILWEVDQDTGSKSVYDIYEGVGKFAIYLFNRRRTAWADAGLLVDLAVAV